MLPTLDWEPFLVSSRVRAAFERLQGMTRRNIYLHPLSLAPDSHAAFRYATRESERYFIDETADDFEHSIVHELLHGILLEEGYDYIKGQFHKIVHPILFNDLQHPEVFRRMEGYGLPMTPYWERWRTQLRRGMDVILRGWDQVHLRYADFPRVYSWFWFTEASAACLEEYRGLDPALYEAARATHDATKGIGFGTPEANRACLGIIRDRWLQHCTDNPLDSWSGPQIVEAVARTQIVPATEVVYARSEERLYENLRQCGVRCPEVPA